MAPTLGYWDIRGLASPIRLLLHQAGVQFEDKHYSSGPPPFNRPEWPADKFSLGLDFPNLPYYIDGDVKLSQSSVILRHLARKHGFVGKNETDQVRAELLAAQLNDYHMDYAKIVYNPEFNKLKGDYIKSVPARMEALTKFLGDRKFVVGDYVTFVDFLFFEYLEGQVLLQKDLLNDYPVLKAYHARVLALEGVDKYFKSEKAIKTPFFGGPAAFGGPYSHLINKEA